MTDYAEYVLNSYPKIKEQIIDVPAYDLSFTPFANWNIDSPSQSLTWWKAFNDIKHKRSKYKKKASQINVLNILGALFLLERKFLQEIAHATDEADIPDNASLLFTLRDWSCKYTPASGLLFSNTSDSSPIIGGGSANN